MSISAETQNQIQQCLDRLSEVAKTPEERVEAIYMAWDGYKREQELKNYKRLQDLGTEVLTAGYEIWRDEGIKLIESAMVEAEIDIATYLVFVNVLSIFF